MHILINQSIKSTCLAPKLVLSPLQFCLIFFLSHTFQSLKNVFLINLSVNLFSPYYYNNHPNQSLTQSYHNNHQHSHQLNIKKLCFLHQHNYHQFYVIPEVYVSYGRAQTGAQTRYQICIQLPLQGVAWLPLLSRWEQPIPYLQGHLCRGLWLQS